jgi:transcriptional regulator with XRE-family HTH domain
MNPTTAAPAAPAPGVPVLTIADRLLIARRQTGLDTKEFAERTNISKATINNYENPAYDRARKPLYLRAWALAAGVSYTWLATGHPPEPDAADQPNVAFLCISGGQHGGNMCDPSVPPLAA